MYQIPRYRSSQRRTQPYGEDKTFMSNINDLIINTILEVQQLIVAIAQFKTFEDPKFHNLFDFPINESESFNLPETQEGSFGPPQPPDTNPPITFIPPSQPNIIPNFILGGILAENQPWRTIDALSIPSALNALPKSLENLLPKFDLDNDELLKDNIKQFMLTLRLMNLQHKDVVCRLFPSTFQGKASIWFFNLDPRSIALW